jgi:peptide/nickel transport system substrate-binding protein
MGAEGTDQPDVRGGLDAAVTQLSRRQVLQRGAVTGAGIFLAGVLAPEGIAGFLRSGAGTPAVLKGGLLRVLIDSEPDILDPAKSPGASAGLVDDLVFSRLVRMDVKGNYVPDLATDWHAADNKTWVFNLNKNARFHDGSKVTTEAVKYTFDRILAKATNSPWAGNFTSIARTQAKSASQVVFHLKAPYNGFLTSLALSGQIVNPAAIGRSNAGRHPIGSGPFQFVEWVHGDHILLERNKSYYHHGLPLLDRVRIGWQAVSSQSLQALKSNQIDLLFEIPGESIASVQADPSLHFVTSQTAGKPRFIVMQNTVAPLDNRDVRSAIAWAIDRDVIRKVAFFGAGQTGSEEVPTGSKWYDHTDPFHQDVAKAKQLIQQSGVQTPINITFLAETSSDYPTRTGEVLKDQLAPIGINLDVQQVDGPTWFNAMGKGTFQMSMAYWERTIDPDDLYSVMLVSTSPQNIFHYKNPTFDALIAKASALPFAQAKNVYTQARKIVWQDVPIIFAHYDTPAEATRRNVVGARVTPTLELGLDSVGFSK